MLYGSGLRRSEAVALDVADIDLGRAAVRVRNGKGAKARMTYLPAGAVAAVAAWLRLRGDQAGPLFVPVRRGGHLQPGRGCAGRPSATSCAAGRPGERGGVDPHDLRRSRWGICWTPERTWPS